MSFTLPTFNLTCNVWSPASLPPNPPRVVLSCNLAFGRRVHPTFSTGTSAIMELLLPVHSDVRSPCQNPASLQDVVEVPAGSGRFYFVLNVDDAGKGFTNEHRVAQLTQTRAFGAWPIPMP